MTYRKLLLPLTADAAGEAALATGLMLAKQWGAHLTCLAVQVDSRDVAPLAGEGLSGTMIEEMMHATERQNAEAARQAAALFARAAETLGVEVAESGAAARPGEASTSFTAVVGREEELVPALARLSDLTVLPHPKREADAAGSDALHAVLFDSGRPVLIAHARRRRRWERAAPSPGTARIRERPHSLRFCLGCGRRRRCGCFTRLNIRGAIRRLPRCCPISPCMAYRQMRPSSGWKAALSGPGCWRGLLRSAPICWAWELMRTRVCARLFWAV